MLQGAVRTGGTRLSDVVGRLGGEEFGVLLVAGDIETAMSIAERVRETLQNMVVETGGDPLTITGSFGLAELVPGESLDALYQRADQACYEAKDHGRNRVEVAST
jgi:diguanylate cyclase (GGDEF)-like protein